MADERQNGDGRAAVRQKRGPDRILAGGDNRFESFELSSIVTPMLLNTELQRRLVPGQISWRRLRHRRYRHIVQLGNQRVTVDRSCAGRLCVLYEVAKLSSEGLSAHVAPRSCSELAQRRVRLIHKDVAWLNAVRPLYLERQRPAEVDSHYVTASHLTMRGSSHKGVAGTLRSTSRYLLPKLRSFRRQPKS